MKKLSEDLRGIFDHQLVTLSELEFFAVRKCFRSEAFQKAEQISWKDDGDDTKGFVIFEDRSYLEIWNEAKFNSYGYQDACRLDRQEDIEALAVHFQVQHSQFPSLCTVGRTGWTGNPHGGMFFLWQPSRQIDPQKNGIREILSVIPADGKGKIPEAYLADYRLAQLLVQTSPDGKLMQVHDQNQGVQRIFVARPNFTGNGLIALRYSRNAAHQTSNIVYKNQDGNPLITVKLEDGFGTIIFRADLLDSMTAFSGVRKAT